MMFSCRMGAFAGRAVYVAADHVLLHREWSPTGEGLACGTDAGRARRALGRDTRLS
jgi:hypothetical protein